MRDNERIVAEYRWIRAIAGVSPYFGARRFPPSFLASFLASTLARPTAVANAAGHRRHRDQRGAFAVERLVEERGATIIHRDGPHRTIYSRPPLRVTVGARIDSAILHRATSK